MDDKGMGRNMATSKEVLKINEFQQSNSGDYECTENTKYSQLSIVLTIKRIDLEIN